MTMRNRHITILLLVALLAALTSCERRELYVYGDEFSSVILNVDWRQYSERDPDGMTAWFYPLDDPGHAPYRFTTAEVRRHELYLPGGRYQGVVVDYSPEEYSRIRFVDIDDLSSARVEATPAYQPDGGTVSGEGVPAGLSGRVNAELYGEAAWTVRQGDRPAVTESGYYTVASQPEQMALDTLDAKTVSGGQYGNYIPYKERDSYQTTFTLTNLYAVPTSVIWQLRVRVFIRDGFNSLWQTPSSISGLADGHFLPRDVSTDRCCLLAFNDWQAERTGDNCGYIAVTVTTFGLRPSTVLPGRVLHDGTDDGGDAADEWYWYYTDNCLPDDLQLNLAFVLRDHATLCSYHIPVGDAVVSYDRQHVLRIDIDPGITLPYVDAYDGAGFGADVTPWDDLPPVDVGF